VDYVDLFVDDKLDAIVVVMLVLMYYVFVKQVLEVGKYVFVEKLLVMRVVEMDEFVEFVVVCDCVLMFGYLLFYYFGVLKLKELIDLGEFGDVFCVYGNW